MDTYHVHIYRVQGLIEINLEAETPEEAKQKALEKVKTSGAVMTPADCDFIAMAFKSEEPG